MTYEDGISNWNVIHKTFIKTCLGKPVPYSTAVSKDRSHSVLLYRMGFLIREDTIVSMVWEFYSWVAFKLVDPKPPQWGYIRGLVGGWLSAPREGFGGAHS
jgi:hypothetical protein